MKIIKRVRFGEAVPPEAKFICLDKYAFSHTKIGNSIFPDWEQVAIYEIPVVSGETLNAEKPRQEKNSGVDLIAKKPILFQEIDDNNPE